MVDPGEGNCTAVTEFILLGLSDVPELRVFLSLLFLLIYGVTFLANLGMITLIQVSSRLHTPMYFFLSHLSFLGGFLSLHGHHATDAVQYVKK